MLAPERLLFWGFAVFVAATPFWFGGNGFGSLGFNAVVAGLLLAGRELLHLTRGEPHAVKPAAIWPEIALFVIVCMWCLFQVVTWSPSDWHHPIWSLAGDALGRAVPGRISINPDATILALLRLLTAGAVFWLALQFCRDPRNAVNLLRVIAIAGALYAVYGVISAVFFPDRLLWVEKTAYRESVTATFVNRNSYATYAGMGLACAIALVLANFRRAERIGNVRFRAARIVEIAAGEGGLFLVVAFIIAVALLLTGSRAGITSSLFGIVVLLTLIGARKRSRRHVTITVTLLVLVATGLALASFGDLYTERLAQALNQGQDRLAVYALTWRSVLDAPLLGFGYGTFADVFPMYRDATVGPWSTWSRAHNTYLEVLQGLGLAFGGALLLCGGLLVFRCIHGAISRRRDGFIAALGASASAIVLLHSFADFSLQMQGVSLTWVCLLGAGVAQSWSSRDRIADW